MPLVISEIGIRVRVERSPATPAARAPQAGANALTPEAREELLQDCIRRTLAVLDARRER